MRCEELENHLPDLLAGTLDGEPAAEVAAHLTACPACRAEAEALGELWEALGRLPEEAPGEALRDRFYAMLAGERARLAVEGGAAPPPRRAPLAGRLRALSLGRPLAQLGMALAALVVGVLVGTRLVAPRDAGELGELKQEVRSLNQLVTLSLLQQSSASDRLRGVSFGRRLGEHDERVVEALIDTVRHDPNVNVRLAAIDALASVAARPAARQELLASFPEQKSPMVQIALVDLLLDSDGEGARRSLADLETRPNLDPTVRDYLRKRLAQRL